MFADSIGQPLVIEGQTVVLLPDIVGMVPVTEQHEYVEITKSTNTCAAIQMREADIEAVRKLYPKLPVYGLWQTLLASDVVDVKSPLQVVPITSLDGYYVHADVGRLLYSGNYDAGFFAADTGFRLSNAKKLDPKIDSLILPKRPAQLAREILSSRRRVYRDGALKTGVAVAVMMFGAFCLDFGLQVMSEQSYASIVEKDNALDSLRKDFNSLSKNRLIERPDQSTSLERLAEIIHDFEEVQFQEPFNFRQQKIVLQVAAAQDPALLYPYVTSSIRPDGRWDIIVNLGQGV